MRELINFGYNDPEVAAWESTTEVILNATFGQPNGEPHEKTLEFNRARYAPGSAAADYEHQRSYRASLRKRKALLGAFIDQLDILAPTAATAALNEYRFHPEIERVSGQLFRDGHYKHAALEAYIRVIDEVKQKVGLNLDGDPLMNRAFGCDNQTPVIQFNSLQTDAERDEQKGFMFLFKGIVGLRNSKAHSNTLFNDPYRAHDYLALASLLMRVLEIATTNRP
jgi:uncharacterized protein (TIGR02391 family)